MIVRDDELNPHDRRFDTADDEEHEPVEDVENPQLLVIHGDNPVVEPLADRPGVAVDCAEARLFPRPSLFPRLYRSVSRYVVSASRSFSFNFIAGINEPGLIASGF